MQYRNSIHGTRVKNRNPSVVEIVLFIYLILLLYKKYMYILFTSCIHYNCIMVVQYYTVVILYYVEVLCVVNHEQCNLHCYIIKYIYSICLVHINNQWPLWSYGSWIYNYLCNQCLSPPTLRVRISLIVRCTQYIATLCDKACQWLTTGSGFLWYSGFLYQ